MSWFNIIKKLSGNQHRIDSNKDGKITAEDFKQLREGSDDTEKLAPLAATAGAVAFGSRMASADEEKIDVVSEGKKLSNQYKKEGKRLSNKFKQ
tara:strand:- start:9 stop:290 length:282 start_codon:yes stop_codon:yes gene_type:complete